MNYEMRACPPLEGKVAEVYPLNEFAKRRPDRMRCHLFLFVSFVYFAVTILLPRPSAISVVSTTLPTALFRFHRFSPSFRDRATCPYTAKNPSA